MNQTSDKALIICCILMALLLASYYVATNIVGLYFVDKVFYSLSSSSNGTNVFSLHVDDLYIINFEASGRYGLYKSDVVPDNFTPGDCIFFDIKEAYVLSDRQFAFYGIDENNDPFEGGITKGFIIFDEGDFYKAKELPAKFIIEGTSPEVLFNFVGKG